jgi:prepilin-type N-terminal cleavage/methylation domain-containing protein
MKKSPRAGFTLLELLAAVALTGMVVAGSGWFVRTASERSLRAAEHLRQSSATEALFDSIGRDLLLGDATLPTSVASKAEVTSGTLAVVTRATTSAVGAVVHEYSFRAATGEVLCCERAANRDGGHAAVAARKPVLGGVRNWDASFDSRSRVLTVTLAMQDGGELGRCWRVP